jgi:hypothetical protein
MTFEADPKRWLLSTRPGDENPEPPDIGRTHIGNNSHLAPGSTASFVQAYDDCSDQLHTTYTAIHDHPS